MDVGYLENLKADTLQRDHSRLLGIIPKMQNEERTRQHGWVFCLYLSWSLIFILLDLASPLTTPAPTPPSLKPLCVWLSPLPMAQSILLGWMQTVQFHPCLPRPPRFNFPHINGNPSLISQSVLCHGPGGLYPVSLRNPPILWVLSRLTGLKMMKSWFRHGMVSPRTLEPKELERWHPPTSSM